MLDTLNSLVIVSKLCMGCHTFDFIDKYIFRESKYLQVM